VAAAAGALGADGPNPAPHEQDGANTSEDRPAVNDDANDEEEGSNDGAGYGTVVTSEEKQHDGFLSGGDGWEAIRRG
jgi:hypothetical protein